VIKKVDIVYIVRIQKNRLKGIRKSFFAGNTKDKKIIFLQQKKSMK